MGSKLGRCKLIEEGVKPLKEVAAMIDTACIHADQNAEESILITGERKQ